MKFIALFLLLFPAICSPSNLNISNDSIDQFEQRTIWYKLKWKKWRPFPSKDGIIHYAPDDVEFGSIGVNINSKEKVMIRYRVRF